MSHENVVTETGVVCGVTLVSVDPVISKMAPAVHVTVRGTPPVIVQPVNLRVTLLLIAIGYVPDLLASVAVADELVQLIVALPLITSRVALVAVAVTAPPGVTVPVEALAWATAASDAATTKTGTIILRMRDNCHRSSRLMIIHRVARHKWTLDGNPRRFHRPEPAGP
jgi:hypothetical protein